MYACVLVPVHAHARQCSRLYAWVWGMRMPKYELERPFL